MRPVWLVALLWAAPVFSQVRVAEVPAVDIHPLVAGSVADPAHPVLATLQTQWASLALAAPAALPQAVAQLAAGEPHERFSVGVLVRALSDTRAAASLAQAKPGLAVPIKTLASRVGPQELAKLAELSRSPAVDSFFDGSRPAPLELDGLDFKRGRLRDGPEKAGFMGQGGFGRVDEHPRVPGAVVKTVEVAFENLLFGSEAELKKNLAEEEPTARRLAEAGVGPRFLGHGKISGRSSSVRERVYGRTMQSLVWDRRFGPEEARLVEEMLDRMAAAGLQADDLHPRNIVIGRTVLVPERRAYLVDGGKILDVQAGTSREELRKQIDEQLVVVVTRFDPNVGEITTRKPFRAFIDDGLRRFSRTSWRQRLVDGLKEAFLSGGMPAR